MCVHTNKLTHGRICPVSRLWVGNCAMHPFRSCHNALLLKDVSFSQKAHTDKGWYPFLAKQWPHHFNLWGLFHFLFFPRLFTLLADSQSCSPLVAILLISGVFCSLTLSHMWCPLYPGWRVSFALMSPYFAIGWSWRLKLLPAAVPGKQRIWSWKGLLSPCSVTRWQLKPAES